MGSDCFADYLWDWLVSVFSCFVPFWSTSVSMEFFSFSHRPHFTPHCSTTPPLATATPFHTPTQAVLRSKATSAAARARIELIDMLLEYAGARVRGGDLFANQSVASKAAKFFELFSSDFRGAESALTMHKPYLADIVTMLNGKALKPTEFPYVEGDPKRQYNHKFVILFMVGGATFEEAAMVAALNAANPAGQRIILGGTAIHNSQSFLADVSGGLHATIDVGDEKTDDWR